MILTENQSELWMLTDGFDDLLLTGETAYNGEVDSFSIEMLEDNTSFGEPQPVDVQVQRWMTDGAVASTQGHDNRELTFQVLLSATTSIALAQAEAELASRASKPCLLLWTGPAGADEAPTTVFEVWTWHLSASFDGVAERYLERTYTVTATAKPWTRSLDLTTVNAITTSVSPTTVAIDDCHALSGSTPSTYSWSAPFATATISGGTAVNVHATYSKGATMRLTLERVGAVSGLAALPYLAIDILGTSPTWALSNYRLSVILDGDKPLDQVATVGTVTYWQLPAGTTAFGTLNIRLDGTTLAAEQVTLQVADVSATDTIAGVGSHKQLIRSLTVGGSVPTSGSIKVASPAGALGTVLVYTCKDAGDSFSPMMRQYRTSGQTLTVDTTAVSGQRETLVNGGVVTGPVTFQFPANNLPQGSYAVVGRFYASGTNTLNVSVTAGVTTDLLTAAGTTTWTSANSYQWATLGVLDLPSPPLPPQSTATMTVTITATSGSTGAIYLDELYLLDVTHGTVSLIDCGTKTRLWIDAPDTDPVLNLPAYYVGTVDDRSDAVGVWGTKVLSRGDHDLDPHGAIMLTVCSVNDAAVSASFYHRWHTHAGD